MCLYIICLVYKKNTTDLLLFSTGYRSVVANIIYLRELVTKEINELKCMLLLLAGNREG